MYQRISTRSRRNGGAATAAAALAGALALFVAGSSMAGSGDPIVDENPPTCDCFSAGGVTASRNFDSFNIFFDSFVFCSISDSRPTEDSNGNGTLDPGEDLNGNGFIDEDTGVFDVSLQPGSLNTELFVFFAPGDPFVFADISTDDFSGPAAFTLQATDGAGNMCLPAIQLEEFDPTGGLDMFPSTTINLPVPLPPTPGGPPITAVQCIDLDPFDSITSSDFDGASFTPVNGDPTIIPNYTFNDSGDRVLCCQFAQDDGSVSSPLCAFTTVDAAPSPEPPDFVAGRPKPGKLDLLWSAVDGADEYAVLRGQGPMGVALAPIGTSNTTLFVDFNVFPGTVYTYAIQTVAGGLTSDPSVQFEVFVPAIRSTANKATDVRGVPVPIDIFEFSVYFSSSETGPPSLRDTVIGLGPDTLTAGLDVTFANGLGGNNTGTMTWTLTNNTGGDLTNVALFGFLDAEIDEPVNTFFNEFGTTSDLVLGGGAGDGLADSFEIDEPGFVFGDIIGNLLAGSLDNSNTLTPALSDDVSLALGFDIGTLLAGQSLTATFDISLINNNGLGHVDPNSNFQFWYNGFVELGDTADTDDDSVVDSMDNCTLVPNPLQQDTDLDGYGNICDGDFDNNGIVNLADLAQMKLGFFGTDPNLDMDSDGQVNFPDLTALKNTFFLPPGPSGLPCAGTVPCQ